LFRRHKIAEHLDTIVQCTDKLLCRWRSDNNDPTCIYLNMVEQSQQLLIDIFGLIGFDYDLHTLDNENDDSTNELVHALYTYISTTVMFTQLPEVMGRIYLFFNLRYRRAQHIIDRYLNQMIEQELKDTLITRAERKKTSFIASLVTSLQENEIFETTDVEENKKGR
jgi:cytochrome P450